MSESGLFSFENLLDEYVENRDEIQIDDSVDLLSDDELNIVEFAESPKGLNFKLRPVQRFILKLLYGIPLDSEVAPEVQLTDDQIQDFIAKGEMADENDEVPLIASEQIRFRHPISGIMEGPFSEIEYLEYLREWGPIKKTNGVPNKKYKTLVLSIGRRGGKSTMSTIISCYEIYKLLRMRCPQEKYGLKKTAVITVILVGTDRNQSELLFDDIVSYAIRSPYLGKYLVTHLKKEIEFATPFDMAKATATKKVKPTLKIKPVSCNASSIRGVSAIQGIMDEVAHMRSSASKRASAEEVYKAIKPAVSTFDDGKMILISSPNGSTGFFHNFFTEQIARDDGSTLCIQAPTWEVNPGRVSDDDFLTDYMVNKNTFYQEWEAKFEASVRAYIEQFNLFERVLYPVHEDPKSIGLLPARNKPTGGAARIHYYLSIDQGFKDDGTVVSIGHYDSLKDKIIVDFVKKYVPGDERYSLTSGRLSFKKLVNDVIGLTKRFFVVKGFFDIHQGSTIEESFQDHGANNFFQMNTSDSINSEVYSLLEKLYSEERIEIPGEDWLVKEFRDLEVKTKRGLGDNRKIKVEAGSGSKDDGPDSVARLIYVIYKEVVMGENVVGDPTSALVKAAGNKVVTSLKYNEKVLKRKMDKASSRYLTKNNRFSASRFVSGKGSKSRR